jgi:hypothetical protein
MFIVSVRFFRKTKINGIAIFPFIFLRNKSLKDNKILINHEKIHIRQQIELLIIFFYFWYVAEYYYWYLKLGNKQLAYRSISFEREAYANEENLHYLKTRKFWNFLKY